VRRWLGDVKDSDKVALLVLYSGLIVVLFATAAGLAVTFHAGANEALVDRSLSIVKDLFGVGVSLITGACLVLRFQSKGGTPPGAPDA